MSTDDGGSFDLDETEDKELQMGTVDDDYLLNRLIDLGEGDDEVSQMISPPTVISAKGTDCNHNLGTASFVTCQAQAYGALLTCIIELIYEGCHRRRQIPIRRRRRGKSFATLNNIVALACALAQCVVTTINYSFESPIKLTVSPIILANGVLFSKILKY
ncbi:hypothetical protein Q3G72_024510 [Acer saccharum]|nr:hypothetical protein Q3G72_024510 [Acer saccharum]